MKANKRKKIKVGSFLMVMFLLMYIPSFFHWVYGSDIRKDMIRIGTLEDAVNTDAYLVRDEEVLKSPFEGKYIKIVQEGEKVQANSEVAKVVKDTYHAMLEEVKEIELNIIQRQKQINENREFFSSDINKLDERIQQELKKMIGLANQKNLRQYQEMKETVDSLIRKKATIFGGASTSDSVLNAEKKKKEELLERIEANKKLVHSSHSGVVSYGIDGYEEILSPGTIQELTPEVLEEIDAKKLAIFNEEDAVEAQKPFAKVIKDLEGYLVISMDSKKADFFIVGDSLKIRITDVDKVVDAVVYFKSEVMDGKNIVVVKFDQGISETAGLRKVNIDIIKSTHKGLRVRLSSLRDIDETQMKAKIVLVKANYASIREVKIVGKNEEFAIIDNLEGANTKRVDLYDTYVINPKNIDEGQMISE